MIDGQTLSFPGGRPENEDSVYFAANGDAFAAAVADGLGGHGGGALASRTCVSVLDQSLNALFPLAEENVRALFDKANEAVCALQTNAMRMKSTLATALFDGRTLCLAHVGDSRVYVFRNDAVIYQSLDHSVSQMAVFAGEITPEEIRGHVDRNKVLRAIGTLDGVKPDVRLGLIELAPSDGVLLCSDGFWEYVYECEMVHDMRHTPDSAGWLLAMANRLAARVPPNNDNFSAVAVRIGV